MNARNPNWPLDLPHNPLESGVKCGIERNKTSIRYEKPFRLLDSMIVAYVEW